MPMKNPGYEQMYNKERLFLDVTKQNTTNYVHVYIYIYVYIYCDVQDDLRNLNHTFRDN